MKDGGKWRKAWWDLHDPITEALQKTPKVLVPDVAKSNRFAADNGHFIPQHSAYYILPQGIEPGVLAAILNSTAIEFLVRSQAPIVKDGFSRYRSQFLQNLPIPKVAADIQEQISLAMAEGRHHDLAILTSGLFGVDAADVEQALLTVAPDDRGIVCRSLS